MMELGVFSLAVEIKLQIILLGIVTGNLPYGIHAFNETSIKIYHRFMMIYVFVFKDVKSR